MTTLIQQLITKMGLYDIPGISEKTTELVRLLELRSTNVPLQVNEYGKIVICADLAASLLSVAFDKEQALKLSGLRKSHYANNKRMFEKLLDLNKLMGVNDICIQLNLNEVNKKANEMLELYKKLMASEQTDLDISHPQYAAMAVFQACKLSKHKVSKTKIMPFSNLRPTQWQLLEQRWDKFVAKQYKSMMENRMKASKTIEDHVNSSENKENSQVSVVANKKARTEIEEYDKWKQRMLKIAHEQLKLNPVEDAEDMRKDEFSLILGF